MFEDITIEHLKFNENYKIGIGSTGQLIRYFKDLHDNLNGEGAFKEKKKTRNKYQEMIYPELVKITKRIIDKYETLFLKDTTDPIQKKIYGYNLNGYTNAGMLSHYVYVRGVRLGTLYKNVFFGHSLNVLLQRLNHIEKLDPSKLGEFARDTTKLEMFKKLQEGCTEFIKFISDPTDGIYVYWNKTVNSIKDELGIKPRYTKYTKDMKDIKDTKDTKDTEEVKLSDDIIEKSK